MKGNDQNQGFSTIEFILGAVLMSFIIFFPIVANMQMNTLNIMEQELNRALQMASVQGRVTSEIQQAVKDDLAQKGMENVSFTSDTTFTTVERGGLIKVGIVVERPGMSLYSGVIRLIGGKDIQKDEFVVRGTAMSEYLE